MFDAVQASTPAELIRSLTWAYAALSTVHIIGVGLLLGTVLFLDAAFVFPRATRDVSPAALAGVFLPWTMAGFAIAATTGALMFIADAVAIAGSPAFQAKVVLICAAGLNAVLLHRSRAWEDFCDARPARTRVKVAAVVSAGLWLSTVTAGRLIAFL